jgi:hypothetical protein
MKDFPFWRGAIYNAKTALILKAVGEDLAQFQKQSGLFGDEEKKLNDTQMTTLRKMYAEKLKKLQAEALDAQVHKKLKFNK